MQVVPRVAPFDRPATYADLQRLPGNMVGEIVDGALYAAPRPAPPHLFTAGALNDALGPPYRQARGGAGGWWILQEPELHLAQDVLVPDVAAWRRDRMASLPSTAYFGLAPDWACEILSPSTASFDRVTKLRIYAREGVSHVWLVDPLARTLEVLGLENDQWMKLSTHSAGEVIRVAPFADIALDLRRLWLEPTEGDPPE